MKIIVDTCIWSLTLRRSSGKNRIDEYIVAELHELIDEGRLLLIGPIRQELLSGISDAQQFEKVRAHLAAFSNELILDEDYENAARMFNTCRSRGIQGSPTDLLICAIAHRTHSSIFTTDKDFDHYSKCFDISRHTPRLRE